MMNRREFQKLALAALPASALAKPNSKIAGVQIGVQSYSFRDRSLDDAIKGMVDAGLSSCELWQGHIEPRDLKGEDLRKWRTSVSLDEFKKVRRKFDAAGIELYAYNYSFRDNFSDEEVQRGFDMAKALGVKRITASSNVTTAKRVDAFARKARIWVGMHNHSNIRPNEFATPQNFADAMAGMSEYIVVNLDIGHFTAAGFDAVDYLKQNHKKIVTLHIKDRKKNQGANVPLGEGDTPIKEVLAVLREHRYPIPANIEYEYKGEDTVAEVKKCYEYCKKALA
ncbi:MAG: sugar phosphate isomerase/epimerase family protein [Bryobacteraceae bacterium]